SVLTKDNLKEWNGMEERKLIPLIAKIESVSGAQREFDYDADFKREFSSIVCKRWHNASSSLRRAFIIVLRVLSREKSEAHALLSKDVMEVVIGSSGLAACCDADIPEDERIEAVKCLVNAFFHQPRSLVRFVELECVSGLGRAVIKEKDGDKRYLYMHLAFIVSAFQQPAQDQWREDTEFIHAMCEESLKWEKSERNATEALKIFFNIFSHSYGKIDKAVVEECLQTGRRILLEVPRGHSHIQNTVNVLGCMPLIEDVLFPKLEEGEISDCSFDGRDMRVAQVVMDDLGDRLETLENVDVLGTYFTLLTSASTLSKAVRRYCRMKIIPPLHAVDVERPPEMGDTMRNKIIRVMHSPCNPRDLAAQFMYVLCKRSVNRLIKYTGLGHSAGLLANSGLLGRINECRRGSDSEDSETDDYKDIEERVNPVTGYVREERPDPMAGMSEEQKEFEAMKLVEAMDRLLGEGIIKPGTIGPDGRPTTVSHVLELVKNVKTPDGSDSD
ncbi:hypothetical protein PFISCL1PPCAC_16195, partial [Pristionchus fissidentatus]